VQSHFGCNKKEVAQRITKAPSRLGIKVSAEFARGGFAQVKPRRKKDIGAFVKSLNKADAVWTAYEAPKPVPAAIAGGAVAGSRNFEPSQGYLMSAPNGIGAISVWPLKGARGEKVRIVDIEGNWNRKHEDLPKNIPLLGGNLIPGVGWRNHGTAVLGEMVSRPNDFGTVGISNRARAAVHSAVISGVFNTGQAIRNAARRLKAGDVILIELQGTGPNGKYVAMQFWADIFSAIRAATAKGITVVEAAGNGDENFDLPIFRNTGLQKDSGAIIVGAGVPPTNYFDNDGTGGGTGYTKIGVPRSRIWFSNYGKIVNVQAWGWHVTSLGYGDAQGGAQDRWYTLRFSGTSSASPIVTGAVACVQGRAKFKRGKPLTPAQVRKLLIQTGTPQQPGPSVPLSQQIGPQPNLQKAIKKI
jgi:subtilisin family serine protease